jgi:proton-translocating NADH-quinone oxidoreductase chain N
MQSNLQINSYLSNDLSLIFSLNDLGFSFYAVALFLFILMLAPFAYISRFCWILSFMISIVFFYINFRTDFCGDFFDHGYYHTQLNHTIKCLSLLCLGAISLAGFSISSKTFTFEFIFLILFSQICTLFILSTDNLIILFLLIEAQALVGYVLAVYRRKSQLASEASIKYFLLGASCSSLMALGIALIYGQVGSFSLTEIYDSFSVMDYRLDSLTILGSSFILVTMFFKLSAAPLHFWTPEVYENSEFLSIGYFSTIPKFPILALLTGQLSFLINSFSIFFYVFGFISLLVGSVSGLFQLSIKKILAYSTIANTAYLLLVLSVYQNPASSYIDTSFGIFYPMLSSSNTAVWIQMAFYSLTVIALTGFLQAFTEGSEFKNLLILTYLPNSYRLTVYILLLSLGGIPPTLGFISKYFMVQTIVSSGAVFLSILLVGFSILSLFFYARIVGSIFLYQRDHDFFTSVEMNLYENVKDKFFFNFVFFPLGALNLGLLLVFFIISPFDLLVLIKQFF